MVYPSNTWVDQKITTYKHSIRVKLNEIKVMEDITIKINNTKIKYGQVLFRHEAFTTM